MPPISQRKDIFAGATNVGKTQCALEFVRFVDPAVELGQTAPHPHNMLVFDFEANAQQFITTEPSLQDVEEGIFCATPVVAPSLYACRLILAKMASPQTPTRDLLVDRKPVDEEEFENLKDDVKEVLRAIQRGAAFKSLLFDPITKVGRDVSQAVLAAREAKIGIEKMEKTMPLAYSQVNKAMAALLFDAIALQIHIICTAWAKNKYDQATKRPTNEEIPEVLRGVDYLMGTMFMLTPHKGKDGAIIYPPDARILKVKSTRKSALKAGYMLEHFTWGELLSAHPRLVLPPPEPVELLAGEEPALEGEEAAP